MPALAMRRAHHAERAIAVLGRRGDVVGVGRHAVAHELGVDPRAAALRLVVSLENDDARTLPHDEAVAVLVERTARPLRGVVPRRQRAQGAESADAHRGDRRLGTAGDHRIGVAAHDDLERVADGVRRCRARRARGGIGALGAEADGDLAGGEIDDGGRDEKRRDLAGTAREQRLVLAFDRGEPADARRDEDADARRGRGRHLQARILHRELRRRNRVLDEDVHLLDVLLFDEPQRIEALDLARDLGRELRRVELGDRPDAARTGVERRPVDLGSDAQRRHEADARDDNSPIAHHAPQRAPAAISWTWRAPRCTRRLP